MKRLFATIAVVLACSALASAQSPATQKPLAEVAKTEEARRKSVRKPAKVYTNDTLKPDVTGSTAPSTASGGAPASAGSAAAAATPQEEVEPGGPKTPEYWQKRMAAARADLERSRLFAESLQSRINALLTDFVNRDDPAQKAKVEAERKSALAELERVKKELDDQNKAITAIQDEARRAGVPSGWLRPGA